MVNDKKPPEQPEPNKADHYGGETQTADKKPPQQPKPNNSEHKSNDGHEKR